MSILGACDLREGVKYATLNSGATGGKGDNVTTVTALVEVEAAVKGNSAKIAIISGTIDSTATPVFRMNVIILGLTIQNVLAPTDAIEPQTTNVWIDHNELSSGYDQDHGKDYCDGLMDITHAGDYITVSYNFLHDHYKTLLVGYSDNNNAEDTGNLRVTWHHNYWNNCYSRGLSLLLIENNVFVDVENHYTDISGAFNSYSTDAGYYAVAIGNEFIIGENAALAGGSTVDQVPYSYTLTL
ncbi:hypothetical protein RUND412_001518 [Rhizina undulata]